MLNQIPRLVKANMKSLRDIRTERLNTGQFAEDCSGNKQKWHATFLHLIKVVS